MKPAWGMTPRPHGAATGPACGSSTSSCRTGSGRCSTCLRRFEQTDVRVVSLAVIETSDCAIIRLVPSDYERGFEILTSAKIPFTESDLLVVKLPDDDRPLLTLTNALLTAEINLCYMYPLLIGVGPDGQHGGGDPRR